MRRALKVLAVAVPVGGIAVWLSSKGKGKERKPPHLNPQEWWGRREMEGKQDTSIKPFQIKFGDEMIKDLKDRLKKHRPFTPPLEGVGFEYGFNSDQLDPWINYWADTYPFAEREKFFNQFPQFKTNIQGLDIHYIRVRPEVPPDVEVIPILLMHGWPGSVREFYEVIPLLTQQAPGCDFAFEVIIPSLPGYGFSDGPVRPGLAPPQIAVIMKNLMNKLGFEKFYVQGGDWGAFIASSMATLYPEDILGHHSNMAGAQNSKTMCKTVFGAYFPSYVVKPHLADRMYPLASRCAFMMEEYGYVHLQATKPDTIGVALSDSPSGLLAYILEKFSTWTMKEQRTLPDGGLVSNGKFSKDQLLDNLMIYWASNSITTSMRLYAEALSKKNRAMNLDAVKSPVPTWVIQAKHELSYQPPEFLKTKYPNLINVTVLDEGGHFLAFELPKVFAEDVFKAVKAFREFHSKKAETKTES